MRAGDGSHLREQETAGRLFLAGGRSAQCAQNSGLGRQYPTLVNHQSSRLPPLRRRRPHLLLLYRRSGASLCARSRCPRLVVCVAHSRPEAPHRPKKQLLRGLRHPLLLLPLLLVQLPPLRQSRPQQRPSTLSARCCSMRICSVAACLPFTRISASWPPDLLLCWAALPKMFRCLWTGLYYGH